MKAVGGDVSGANTGQLRQALDGIDQEKILAEAPGAGQREPTTP